MASEAEMIEQASGGAVESGGQQHLAAETTTAAAVSVLLSRAAVADIEAAVADWVVILPEL